MEDQQHRLVASGIEVPTGMKNPTSGDLSVMLNSVVAAQHGHNFIYRGWDATTDGNPYAHTILRGAVDKHGQTHPNYHYEDLQLLNEMYAEKGLKNPDDIRKLVKGVMIESYIVEGNQKVGCANHVYGKSITDPCLGWEDSERLLYDIAERV